jgi:hypothetical protein
MIDLVEKGFLHVNQEYKQEHEEHNLKLQVYMRCMKVICGLSLDSRRLANTGEQDQE